MSVKKPSSGDLLGLLTHRGQNKMSVKKPRADDLLEELDPAGDPGLRPLLLPFLTQGQDMGALDGRLDI